MYTFGGPGNGSTVRVGEIAKTKCDADTKPDWRPKMGKSTVLYVKDLKVTTVLYSRNFEYFHKLLIGRFTSPIIEFILFGKKRDHKDIFI